MISKPGVLGARPGNIFSRSPHMIDGGDDAPMDEQSNRFFKHLTIGALILVALLVVLAVLGR